MRATGPSTALRCWLAAAVVVGPLLVVPSPAQADGETVVGELVQAWAEHVGPHPADEVPEEPLSWIDPVRGDAVRVPTEELPPIDGLAAGATVEVLVGAEVVDAPADDGLEPAREVLDVELLEAAPAATAAASTASSGVNQVTVVLVRPGGVPDDGTTTADVVATVDEAAAFWSAQSAGRIQLQVEATHGWLTTAATCANPELLFPEVDAAVGWPGVPGDRRHLLLYVPPGAPGCADGLATVGSGIPDGGYLYTSHLMTSIVAHELGHNFSLGHASALQCDGTVDTGRCGLTAYGDWYDVMGTSWQQLGTLNGPHAARLGLLPPEAVATVRTAGDGATVTLSPVSASTGRRAVQILGPQETLWLEYRTASGQDAWLGTADNTAGLQTGVLLRLAEDGDDTSLLLDTSPSGEADWHADDTRALTAPGQRADFADGDLAVRVTAMSPDSVTLQVLTPIEVRYEGLSWLGVPSGPQACGLRDGGCRRDYAAGSIYWSPAVGARFVRSRIHGRYAASGAEGRLGYPVQDTSCTAVDQCVQRFQSGWIQSTSPTNVRAVWGAIGRTWTALGGPAGPVGHPVTDERCGLVRSGCFQGFLGGTVYWSPASGARWVDRTFMGAYGRASYERGRLGYPRSHTLCTLRDDGCVQRFQGGLLYRSAATASVAVRNGAILRRYGAGRYENGPLRYPVAGERCISSGTACTQYFQGGTIAWTSRFGAKVVRPPIAHVWHESAQGWPVREQACGLARGGCLQKFQRATIYWSSASGAHAVGYLSPRIARAWAAQGWERGRLGYPTGPERLVRRGYSQRFQGGTLVHDIATGRVRRV